MRQVIFELKRLQRRAHFMLMAQRLSVLLAGIGGMTLVLVGLDYLLRLPGTARLLLLGSALAALGYAFSVYLRPAFRFRPGLTELALRAEEIFPAMAGHLASSVEFAESGLDRTNPLAARSVRETLSRLAGESLGSMMSPRRSVRDGAILLAVAAAVMGVTLAAPEETWTGLQRLFAPYSSARWPARTDVASLMDELKVHPRGQALSLRASVTLGEPDHVDARYRYQVDGRFGPWQRIVLTDQGGRVHERLVDTNAEAIRFYFHTDDANTQTHTIRLEEAPAVRRATLHTTPPAYASAWHQQLAVDLGPGLDERAISETASLVGSEVTLSLRLNKPLPVPESPAELLRTLGWEAPGGPPVLEAPERVADLWTLRWQLAGTTSLNLQLTDTFGLVNPEPIAYVIKALDDRPPSVIILEPASDEPVLASAVVGLQVEARDDVALANLAIQAGLELSTTNGPADGVGDKPAEPASEQAEPPFWGTLQEAGEPSAMLAADLLLADYELSAGDVVLLRGAAEDVFDLDGTRHPPAFSSIRRLRIISELELAHRLRRDLGAVRQNAIRIEALQGELQEDVVDDGVGPGLERAQAKIGERIATQREAVDQVGRRMASNRLADEQLAGLIAQVGDLLDFAGRAANRAVEQIEQRQGDLQRAPDAPPDAAGNHGGISPVAEELQELPMPEPAEADRPIVEAQQEVREELADLIRLLDRDEDAWVAMRWLENLMRSQGQLESQTARLDRRTMGRSLDELTTQEQGELGRIAERQRDLAEQGRQLLKDLRDRAQELSEVDPTTASAMQDAADTGEQRELDRQMTSAAERVSQNQLHTARAAQQAAQEAMARMLENLRQTRRAGAEEVLRRTVAEPLGTGLLEAAFGVHTVTNVTMMRAIRAVSTYRGRDPRDFALLAFGGSGPVHAAGIARDLGIRRVIVPPAPGLHSAVGLLEALPEYHFVQTFFSRASDVDPAGLTGAYEKLESRAVEALKTEGYEDADIALHRSADLRYVGQAYELRVDAPAGKLTTADVASLMTSINAGDHWHDNMVRLVGHWIGRDWSDDEILTAAEAMTFAGYTVEQTRADDHRVEVG
ncbi:MAG: hypothetical protein IH804_01275, partial [Planctomycetes bacterium]|nr:hypothetical protein [Planctomycetota bacterium]